MENLTQDQRAYLDQIRGRLVEVEGLYRLADTARFGSTGTDAKRADLTAYAIRLLHASEVMIEIALELPKR